MKTILIIEDNLAHLKMATLLLERAGYQVLSAGSAEVGLVLARAQRPDLILMDINLPGMDGLAATRALKLDALTSTIPVIAVSSFLADFPDAAARDAGCAGFLAKPYHYGDLLTAVAVALKVGA